jgi:hypothetical protein
MKEITNRSAIIVSPKHPFVEWANLYNESSNEDLNQRLEENHIYLIDWAYDEKIDQVISQCYFKIFEYVLSSWNSIKKEWPQNRSYELFREWFELRVSNDLFDLETEAIESEKL